MTPLDNIEEMKGKEVIIELISGEKFTGKLLFFDLYSNVGIEIGGVVKFINGNRVCTVSNN